MKSSVPADRPIRAVSLAPSLTEIVFAIGATNCLVGRSRACDYPPGGVRSIPVVGDFGKPWLEALIQARPTLEIDTGLADASLARKLAKMGIRHEEIPCRSVADIPAAIRRVGRLLDRRAPAETLADRIETGLRRLAAASSNAHPPTVFLELWNDPLMTAGRETFLSEMIRLAGGRNLGDEARAGYFKVSSEWVLSKHPDIVICTYGIPGDHPADRLARRPGWRNLPAVRNRRVYRLSNPDPVLRPGPRILEGIRELQTCIHPVPHQPAAAAAAGASD